jgi:hypothetical protein
VRKFFQGKAQNYIYSSKKKKRYNLKKKHLFQNYEAKFFSLFLFFVFCFDFEFDLFFWLEMSDDSKIAKKLIIQKIFKNRVNHGYSADFLLSKIDPTSLQLLLQKLNTYYHCFYSFLLFNKLLLIALLLYLDVIFQEYRLSFNPTLFLF